MNTLSIDFASHDGHIACIEADRTVAIAHVTRVNDTDMIALIDGVLKDAGWKKQDIERIVRGGVAFANALADQLHVPLAGYHGSALALVRASADVWTHSTRQDQLFVLGRTWTEPTLVSLENVSKAIAPGTTVTGDLLDTHRAMFTAKGAVFPPLASLESVLPLFLDGVAYGKDLLVPWYGRGI
jgi:tRNA A37 threonylcarbamoyladenosine modification protein TsaB